MAELERSERIEKMVEEAEKKFREGQLLLMSRLKLLYDLLKEGLIEGFKHEYGLERYTYSGQKSLDDQIREFIHTYEELNRLRNAKKGLKG